MKRSAIIVTILPLVAVAYLVCKFVHSPWTAWRVTGLILLVPALLFLTMARIQLGNSFSLAPKATTLVTHGIYSRVRNPVYVFGLMVLAGLFLFLGQPYLLLLLVPLIVLQITRARAEARVLEERFGDEYRRYKASTWF